MDGKGFGGDGHEIFLAEKFLLTFNYNRLAEIFI